MSMYDIKDPSGKTINPYDPTTNPVTKWWNDITGQTQKDIGQAATGSASKKAGELAGKSAGQFAQEAGSCGGNRRQPHRKPEHVGSHRRNYLQRMAERARRPAVRCLQQVQRRIQCVRHRRRTERVGQQQSVSVLVVGVLTQRVAIDTATSGAADRFPSPRARPRMGGDNGLESVTSTLMIL